MVSISKYRQEHKDGKIYIRSEEDSVCPVCFLGLRVIGSKHRKAIDRNGHWQTYVIRRLRCEKCELIHHELPDIFIPYKRHCAAIIEDIVVNETETVVQNATTITRIKHWWKAITDYFEFYARCLKSKYRASFSSTPAPAEIVRAMVNTQHWVHTRSALCPP